MALYQLSYLQLCQKLRQEAGISGSGPLTTANQSGELGRVCDWILQSYNDIQEKHDDWSFLRFDFNLPLTIGQSVYPANINSSNASDTTSYPSSNISDLANWREHSLRCYLTASGYNDEQWINYIEWDLFRDTRLRNANRTASGRPIEFSIKPDKSMVVWPTPIDNYSIDGEYWKLPQTFVNDTDYPVFARVHMVIVYNALLRYAGWVEGSSRYLTAQKEYNRLIAKLEKDRMPRIHLGGAMA